jgi:ATP-dependent Clp protease ATP-binding subunit ClpA
VLIGEPGVGKTSIIHGLAQRLVAGDVPDSISGAKLIGLELGLLTAGGCDLQQPAGARKERCTPSGGTLACVWCNRSHSPGKQACTHTRTEQLSRRTLSCPMYFLTHCAFWLLLLLLSRPGATFPGEFEERLRGVLAELTAAGSNAILFIDDIHSITGPNAQQGGGVNDASVMLKPLLAR